MGGSCCESALIQVEREDSRWEDDTTQVNSEQPVRKHLPLSDRWASMKCVRPSTRASPLCEAETVPPHLTEQLKTLTCQAFMGCGSYQLEGITIYCLSEKCLPEGVTHRAAGAPQPTGALGQEEHLKAPEKPLHAYSTNATQRTKLFLLFCSATVQSTCRSLLL